MIIMSLPAAGPRTLIAATILTQIVALHKTLKETNESLRLAGDFGLPNDLALASKTQTFHGCPPSSS
jgi:hypothetical protein